MIWGTFFRNEMAMLGKVRVEVWPSTLAAFIHIVAIEKHLW